MTDVKKPDKNTTVGVIVGRFQVPELHDGHKDLIEFVKSRHDRVIIFLGLSPCKCTVNNPLDFEARKQMILKEYPDITILYIKDTMSDEVWSQKLDEMIEDIIGPNQKAILYGSRDSFIRHYFGKFDTYEYKQRLFISGTEIRKKVSAKVKSSPEFRMGVIWAVNNQWPKAIPTVDVAIFNEDHTEILLGRKKDEDKWRLIGGFVPPGETWEQTARREVYEETNLEVGDLKYVGSFVIDDWRYRSEVDKITTTLFMTTIVFGRPQPGDDIYELRWFNFNEVLASEVITENHVLLITALDRRLTWKTKNKN